MSRTSQKLIDLAFEIADAQTRSDIECGCRMISGRKGIVDCWYDTSVVDEPDRPFVKQAIRYLDMRELITHHPEDSNLVTFPKVT